MRPKISIGIPTYNQSKLLTKTIKSVLSQDEKDFELIIVDDCSTDDTSQIVKSFKDDRIIYFKTGKNLKPPAVYNFALNCARGKYFVLLDHDDILLSNYLSKMSNHLDNNHNVAYAQCNFVEINLLDKILTNYIHDYSFLELIDTEALDWQFQFLDCKPAAIMLNLQIIKELNEVWEETYWDDWAFYLRIAFKRGMLLVPDVLCCIRNHDQQLNKILNEPNSQVQDYFLHQLISVLGIMQPFNLNSSSIFSKEIRKISISYFFYSIKNLLKLNLKLFNRNFRIAKNLNPLILIDWRLYQRIIVTLLLKKNKYKKIKNLDNDLREKINDNLKKT